MVEFIEGDPVKATDLDRVSARAASAVFILADHLPQDSERVDASQLVRALSVHRYCGAQARTRVIVELLRPEMVTAAIWDDDTEGRVERICPEELRFSLLARSCSILGLTTLIFNLFACGIPSENNRRPPGEEWRQTWEYCYGATQQVYPVLLPPIVCGMPFEQAAEFVYLWSGCLLFALDVALLEDTAEELSSNRGLLLFPRGHVIGREDVGLMVAKDLRTAEQVSKCVDPRSSYSCALHRRLATRRNNGRLPDHASGVVVCCTCPFPLTTQCSRRWREWQEASALKATVQERWKRPSINVPLNVSVSAPATTQDPPIQSPARDQSRAGVAPSGGDSESFEQSTLVRSLRSSGSRGSASEADLASDLAEVLTKCRQRGGDSRGGGVSSPSLGHGQTAGGRRRREAEMMGRQDEVASGSFRGRNDDDDDDDDGSDKHPPCAHANQPFGSKKLRSLEEVVEKLLEWRSTNHPHAVPHPVVLERQQDKILAHLEACTLTVANLSTPHILVCIQGLWPVNLHHFVRGLRTVEGPPAHHQRPVILLHPQRPSAAHWGSVGIFDDVFFVQGSPIFEIDLLRAGALEAEKVVVIMNEADCKSRAGVGIGLSGGGGDGEDGDAYLDTYHGDIQNVMIAANVDRLLGHGHGRLLVEVLRRSTFQFLNRVRNLTPIVRTRKGMWARNPDGLWLLFASFKQGKAFCPSMMDFLMFGTFYNRNVVTLVRQLVGGGSLEDIEEAGKGLPSWQSSRMLDQIALPVDFVKRPYVELFQTLLQRKKLLVLGLYRASLRREGSITPYVYTNPSKDSLCEEGDLVFVLR